MPASTKTALDRLSDLAAAVETAKQRVTEVEAERTAIQRAVDGAEGALAAYYRDVELGNAASDPTRVRKLREAVRDARSDKDTPRLRGMLDGAQQRLFEAENTYRTFASHHFSELVEELAKQAAEVADELEPLWVQLREARTKWWKARRAWGPLITLGAFRGDDFPGSPFPDTSSIPLPMPKALLDGGPVSRPRPVRSRKAKRPATPASDAGSKRRPAPQGE